MIEKHAIKNVTRIIPKDDKRLLPLGFADEYDLIAEVRKQLC